ncbi:hypothetical protein [Mycolicibacterium mucogenicum]|uniref:hypothetical protein n=1 Tax=Mycolicibacterium mucogenicum TaxID=56689 RepID=UPI000A46F719|nr:hypothetical protein [Mycolicibacterium mucogenicum]
MSATDLQRQLATAAAAQASEPQPSDAGGVHWMDRFGFPTAAVAGTELSLATQV